MNYLLICMYSAAFSFLAAAQIATQAVPSSAIGLIPVELRKTAPDFTLVDVFGKPITLSKYKGRVVLLDFWATTCGGCKVELPWYVAFDNHTATKVCP